MVSKNVSTTRALEFNSIYVNINTYNTYYYTWQATVAEYACTNVKKKKKDKKEKRDNDVENMQYVRFTCKSEQQWIKFEQILKK